MKALIDGDILVYRTGFASEDVPEPIAIWRLDNTIKEILVETNSTDYVIWLSDSLQNNFRFGLYPEYKSSRKDKPKPTHYEALFNHLIEAHNADIAWGEEGDDALGIDQDKVGYFKDTHEGEYKTIICSIDKDLLQIPGLHYNWVKKEFRCITEQEGIYNFYIQLLVGDNTDDIPGCPKIGYKKAPKILEGCETEWDMFLQVVETYKKAFPALTEQEIYDMILLHGQLLKIRTYEGEKWTLPKQQEENSIILLEEPSPSCSLNSIQETLSAN